MMNIIHCTIKCYFRVNLIGQSKKTKEFRKGMTISP